MEKPELKIEKPEKEPTLEDIRRYFEEEKDFYSSRGRKMFVDSVLHLKATERWKRIVGYRKIEGEREQRMPGLLEKFKKGEHGCCLAYIEEILGGDGIERATSELDLINHIEYGPYNPLRDRNEDKKTREYQNRKNYLRKLADVLTGETYQKRKAELDEPLSEREKLRDLFQVRKKFEEGNYEEVFEFLDNRIYKNLEELESLKKKGYKENIKVHREELFTLRRYRRYFMNLQEKEQ